VLLVCSAATVAAIESRMAIDTTAGLRPRYGSCSRRSHACLRPLRLLHPRKPAEDARQHPPESGKARAIGGQHPDGSRTSVWRRAVASTG
jgi:hypothetical protein